MKLIKSILMLVFALVSSSNVQAAAAGTGEKAFANVGAMMVPRTRAAGKSYAESVAWFVTAVNKGPYAQFGSDSKNANQTFFASVLAEYDKQMKAYRAEAFERHIIPDAGILFDEEIITALRKAPNPTCLVMHTMLLC